MAQAVLSRPGLRAFLAFRSREFRLVWSAQAVSLIGDAAFLTALGWRTFTLAGSGRLGIVLVCQALAMLTTVLIGGALADRFPRRTLMIVSDIARFGAVGALAAVDAFVYDSSGSATVFALDAVTFLFSASLLWLTKPRPVEPSAAEGTLREIW